MWEHMANKMCIIVNKLHVVNSQQCISYSWPKKEEKPAPWQIFHGLVCMVRRFTLQCHQPNKLLNPHRPMKDEVTRKCFE